MKVKPARAVACNAVSKTFASWFHDRFSDQRGAIIKELTDTRLHELILI